jgi:hypothetical protein
VQHPILIITQEEQGFGRVWLQFLRVFQSFFGRIAARCSSVAAIKIKKRVRTRKSRPGKCKIRVKPDRQVIKIDGFEQGIARVVAARFKSQPA